MCIRDRRHPPGEWDGDAGAARPARGYDVSHPLGRRCDLSTKPPGPPRPRLVGAEMARRREGRLHPPGAAGDGTADFEFTPDAPGDLALEIDRLGNFRFHAAMTFHVRR